MELRTQNEQLRRIDRKIDSIVEDIRTELLARDDSSKELNDRTVKSLLKYIANPLKNITIDGNEMMLDDMLDLYKSVIAELDNVVKGKRYSDEKKLSESELETFKKARDILKTDKEQGIDVIDEVYSEVIKDNRSGKLEKTYIGRKIAENKEIDEINRKIYSIGTEISNSLKPTFEILDKLAPELDLFVDAEETGARIEKIDDKIEMIQSKLSDKDLLDEEIETLEIAKQTLLTRKINDIISSNPEFNKDEYRQNEDETLEDYSERLDRVFSVQKMNNEEILNKKVISSLEDNINIAEYDSTSQTYNIIEESIKDRYFKSEVKDKIESKELKIFVRGIKTDLEELQTAVDSKIDEKTDLEEQKAEIEEEIANEVKTSTLSVVPYIERDDGKSLSEFAKLRQRVAFRFKNPEIFFKNRKEVEDKMCKAKIARSTMQINKEELLMDVEKDQKTFKDKYVVKAKAKSKIYKQWDKNRVPNSRDNDER